MPQLTFLIHADGLCFEALVGLDAPETAARLTARQPIPAPLRVRGMIDTGSNVTVLDATIIQRLGLVTQYQRTTHGITGPVSVNVCYVSLSVTDFGDPTAPWLAHPLLHVMELPVPLPDIELLLGLDVLMGCKLLVDGPARQFTLEF
jgi:hypothetical protein